MGNDNNIIELMIENVAKHHERIRQLNNAQIIALIQELKAEKHVWDEIASGNRNYLENVLSFPTDNYCKGAIPHLIRAFAHRMGFIASKLQEDEMIGDPEFDEVIAGKRKITDLSEPKLVQFVRDFINSESIHKLLKKNMHNIKTLELILGKYDRLHAENAHEASSYLREKHKSIYNLLVKTLLPNLMGAIARQ